MQDLSSCESDPSKTGPDTSQPAAAAQTRTRSMMRSKSESCNKGERTLLWPRKLLLGHNKTPL